MTTLHVLAMLHVLGATVFLGDILLTLVCRLRAARARDLRILAFTNELVLYTDRWLLSPAVFVIVLTGSLMGALGRPAFWTTPPKLVAVILFALSGVVWKLFLVPIQKRQAQLAGAAEGGAGEVPEEYRLLTARWLGWGAFAVALVVASMLLMMAP
jgi:uncharacterized membrane protein